MKHRLSSVVVALAVLLVTLGSDRAFAQNPSGNGSAVAVQVTTPYYSTIPISTTAAVNTATVLTIPAPAAGLYNYVCWLAYQINSDATGGAISNQVTTSTNFNSFALKVSFPATVSIDSGVQTVIGALAPGVGCVKSTLAATATTFTAPAASTHLAWTWYATYYQAQ